jgi:transcriptional regulator with XRE-family HTH domain
VCELSTGFAAAMALSLGEIFARNLRRIRQKRGLSQEELAHRVGINRNYVGMIERGENSPTVEMVERLCAVLEVDPVLLFKRDKS